MTKEEIINLANRCSRKIWEICMEEPGFNTNDCPEGANGLSDIVLNVILKAFPATKECSSFPSGLDEAAEKYAEPYHDKMAVVKAFKAGAEWMAWQGYTTEEKIDRNPLNGPPGICLNLHEYDGFKLGDKVIVQVRKKQ